jgi:hypothetical protein
LWDAVVPSELTPLLDVTAVAVSGVAPPEHAWIAHAIVPASISASSVRPPILGFMLPPPAFATGRGWFPA